MHVTSPACARGTTCDGYPAPRGMRSTRRFPWSSPDTREAIESEEEEDDAEDDAALSAESTKSVAVVTAAGFEPAEYEPAGFEPSRSRHPRDTSSVAIVFAVRAPPSSRTRNRATRPSANPAATTSSPGRYISPRDRFGVASRAAASFSVATRSSRDPKNISAALATRVRKLPPPPRSTAATAGRWDADVAVVVAKPETVPTSLGDRGAERNARRAFGSKAVPSGGARTNDASVAASKMTHILSPSPFVVVVAEREPSREYDKLAFESFRVPVEYEPSFWSYRSVSMEETFAFVFVRFHPSAPKDAVAAAAAASRGEVGRDDLGEDGRDDSREPRDSSRWTSTSR